MEKLDYVKLACSKDERRDNLMHVYRDTDRLVATDGHRLHWCNGLENQPKGYVDGQDHGEFPDYQHVMPKGVASASLTFDASNAVHLLMRLAKVMPTKIGHRNVRLKFEKNAMLVTYTDPDGLITGTVKIDAVIHTAEEQLPDMGMDIAYMVDALAPAKKERNYVSATIHIHGTKAPTEWAVANEFKAVIMPCRIES
jgi:DNA polymerase III sliding clamp (beta) subunit (PCNA family)